MLITHGIFYLTMLFLRTMASQADRKLREVSNEGVEECSTEEHYCYKCDTSKNDPYCGPRMKLSDYIIHGIDNQEPCTNCCVKIQYPFKDVRTPQRFVRACADSLRRSNVSLIHDCDRDGDYTNKNKVCLCGTELCNTAASLSVLFLPLLISVPTAFKIFL